MPQRKDASKKEASSRVDAETEATAKATPGAHIGSDQTPKARPPPPDMTGYNMIIMGFALLSVFMLFSGYGFPAGRRATPSHKTAKGTLEFHLYANGDDKDPIALTIEANDCQDQLMFEFAVARKFHEKQEKYCFNKFGPFACELYDNRGMTVTSCNQMHGGSLWLVPKNRLFVFPFFSRGHRVQIPHVDNLMDKHVELESVNDSPRVFKVHNFFSEAEADTLIQTTLKITKQGYKLERSTTSANKHTISSQRTSENAFDLSSPVARMMKHRIFSSLGIHTYHDNWADGLQVLRYNLTKAYIPHHDYLNPVPGDPHDFDSSGEGTNRFATLFLYLSDVEEGGETVFIHGDPTEETPPTFDEALAAVRAENRDYLKEGSWEEKMVANCRSKLSTKPKKATAILFYNQRADGSKDIQSLHGGCPVLKGTKWAANLWIWNGPRYFPPTVRGGGAAKATNSKSNQLKVTFVNNGPAAKLLWEDQELADFPAGSRLPYDTFVGHVWNIKVGDKTLFSHTIATKDHDKEIIFNG